MGNRGSRNKGPIQSSDYYRSSDGLTKRNPPKIPSYTPTKSNISPILEYAAKNSSQESIIKMLEEFCIPTEDTFIDQYLIIAPIMILFHKCVINKRKKVIYWLMENYFPLQVSYDNNVCFFHAIHHGSPDIAIEITNHHSFVPTKSFLHSLIFHYYEEKKIFDQNNPHYNDSIKKFPSLDVQREAFHRFIRHPNVNPLIMEKLMILVIYLIKEKLI